MANDISKLTVGTLVEADILGTPGTFRVVEGPFAAQDGEVWIRETGLHQKGQEPFLIAWPADKCRAIPAG